MKQLLLFPTFILCITMSFSGFSQYKVDEQRYYEWDESSSDWEHEMTNKFTYDNEGDKETNSLFLEMPGSINQIQVNKQYNANNDITLQLLQFWDVSTMSWQNTSRTEYEYDGANKLVAETTQMFNSVNMTFVNNGKKIYTYSGVNVASETSQFWNTATNTWTNGSRDLYEYSGNDQTLHTEQEWNIATSQWVNEEQTETTYESVGKPSQIIIKEWNSGTSTWDLDERVRYTYTGELMTEANGDDYVGGAWVPDHRTQVTYQNGLPTVALYQEMNLGVWENQDRTLNTFDANGNATVSIYELWDTDTMAWLPEGKIESDYSATNPFVLSSESFDIEDFKIYPNPASEVIHISSFQPIEKMELYDVLGKKVSASANIKQLNVDGIKAGMYMLKVYDKNSSITKKIMIK
ncbi:T9SS type A sorting domain-containing protein [Gelidibacter maritimus]|uniref:T9SS type A sorting domain-containing protein n=1 Tax=Gelidibacter maritimus TaxID=2761487 RepID=A0A7W2M2E7_9FLAO|nr:T9SS type A sorting domain-containing protein [Gelidibacter maritimus]MBA6151464.1 T9SS type A sorting domain-containing protein [Gelidibacter maritimus]